ncbi:YDG domain-containing protein [Mongoliitalea daihaiensis]|uniref:YDG domain-containing protein n=1 Tax=Mongoliitalea daihaiensis TaxID=2782006 RepID=UPI001F3E7275|nr:YDG domain-containing protein [Mongoliitalea daihaiensis]UJP65277.1 T9SS type A sorting domain-containing protein [Mongoliitalea daihaiensis]
MNLFLKSFYEPFKQLVILLFLLALTTQAYSQRLRPPFIPPSLDPIENPTNPPTSSPSLVVTNGNNSGAGSLRQVVADAPAGSMITFSGVTTVTLSTTEIILNKNLTISGANEVTINGGGNSRIFNITGNPTVSLRNLTFTNGLEDLGGAIFNNSSNLEIISCLFENNQANQKGGAIYNNNASPRITNTFFAENHVIAVAPPIVECTAVTNVTRTVSANTLSVFWSPSPAALSYTFNIRASSDTEFLQFQVDQSLSSINLENLVSSTTYSYFITTNCADGVTRNTATFTVTTNASSVPIGPGAGRGEPIAPAVRLISPNGRINSAATQDFLGGGAIFNDGSSPRIVNTLFFSNTVSSTGGPLGAAILNVNGSNPQITNTTFGRNQVLGPNNQPISSGATNFGTIANDDNSASSITNSIIWGNPSGGIVGPNGTVTFSAVENGPTGTGNQNINPQFVSLSSGDLRLQPTSPLRDAGNPSTDLSIFPGGTAEPLDFDANPRVVGGIIDMGAFELELNLQPQTITITPPTVLIYGDRDVSFTATTTSGLPVTYSVESNPFISVNSDGTGLNANRATATPVTITVSVEGNSSFEPASTTLSLPVLQRQLTIPPPIISPKVYDGNTSADITIGTLENKVASDVVDVNATGTFDNPDAGTGKTVSVSYVISGADAGNYITPVDFTSTDGVITPRQLTITPPSISPKVYDGNTSADILIGILENKVPNDVIDVNATGTFDNPNAGTGKTVTVSYVISGADAGNYLTPVDFISTDGVITPRQLTITPPSISPKVYDGNTSADILIGILENKVPNDAIDVNATGTFDNPNAGTGKTVTVSYVISGADAGNYLTPVDFISTDGVITPRQLTITPPSISPKVYDGTTSADILIGILENKVPNDVIDINATGTFDNPNAGTGKTVTVSYVISGADAGNYLTPVDFISTDGVITPRDLFITPFEGQRKAQGSEDPELAFEAIGFVVGEDNSILTGQLGREPGESCGTYEIINSNLSAGNNYTVILTAGVLFEIFDATPPTLILKNISVQLDNSGNASITISDIDNGTTDNCSAFEDLIFEISQTAFTCENTEPITVTVKVTDLAGNSSEGSAEITVLQPLIPISTNISSTVARNQNGNVLIYANAPARLAVPASTVLQAINIPSSYTGLTFEWFVKLDENSAFISIAQTNTLTVQAEGDFNRTYKVVVTSDAGCVAEEQISVISIETSCDRGGNNRVQVCHLPGGNFSRRITLCVNVNAVDAFLRNNPGSFIGNCNITFRLDTEPETISVPWNTSLETIKEIIDQKREEWFGGTPDLTVQGKGFNPFQAGIHTLQVNLDESEGSQLENPVNVKIEIQAKPLAESIELSTLSIPSEIRSGDILATISTIDPADDIHTYHLEENLNLAIEGNQLIWTGTDIAPQKITTRIISTDRAGQSIDREVTFLREIALNEFLLYPNPATHETNAKVQLDGSASVTITVYDITGRILINETTFEEETFIRTLNLDGMATGVYLVQVKIGYLVMTQRLMKN